VIKVIAPPRLKIVDSPVDSPVLKPCIIRVKVLVLAVVILKGTKDVLKQ
jgi:hypothetical protein